MKHYTTFDMSQPELRLVHPENYGIYAGIINFNKITIDVKSLTIETWQSHYDSVLNLFKDGIETECVQ